MGGSSAPRSPQNRGSALSEKAEREGREHPRLAFLRRAALGGGSLAAAAALVARAPDAARADTAFVPRTEPQAPGEFRAVFARVPAGRPLNSTLAFHTGTTVFNGTVDPFVAMGSFGRSGDWLSTFQLEGDWDCGPGSGQPHITEMYWQIIKPDGSSRRPLYGKYDRSLGRPVHWIFMIGNGTADTGRSAPVFAVNWDDDSSQAGVGLFAVRPNRLDLSSVTTGGVAPDRTKIRLYSAPGFGATLALSHSGGSGPESSSTAFQISTDGPESATITVGGGLVGKLRKPTPTSAPLQLVAGMGLGDGSDVRESFWAALAAPSSSVGNRNDWSLSADGHVYFKSGNSWSQKV